MYFGKLIECFLAVEGTPNVTESCAFLDTTIDTTAGSLKLKRLGELSDIMIGEDLLAALELDPHSLLTTKISA